MSLTAADRAHLGAVRAELLAKLGALVAQMDALGYATSVPEHGGRRSNATQAALYADSLAQGGGVLAYPVATPGRSRHEYGAAFDLNIAGESAGSPAYATMAAVGRSLGLTAGYDFSERDPYHFQLNETLQESIEAAPAAGVPVVAVLVVAGIAAAVWVLRR